MNDSNSKATPVTKTQFCWKQDEAGKWHKKPVKVNVLKRMQNANAEPPADEPAKAEAVQSASVPATEPAKTAKK